VELAAQGRLQYLVFECLAERTIALAQKARLLDAEAGYDPLLEERMEAVLPLCTENRVRIISNMGAANPVSAARKTREIAQRLGMRGVRIAAVTGDDVLPAILQGDPAISGDCALAGIPSERLVSANAYLGADALLPALELGADVILTGRVADPSMFVAPLLHEFGWPPDDWNLLGQATVVGHLLECAGQLTGGYFADPPHSFVADLARLGFPLAEVSADGSAFLSKVEGSGGMMTRATCIEQLLYEVQNPAAYLTPDVVADFSGVQLEVAGPDRMRVSGGRGKPRPNTLKVSVGCHEGFVGEGQISYAGAGALARAELARDILAERLSACHLTELRFDFIGVNSILGSLSHADCQPQEVRLRAIGRAPSEKLAGRIPREVEALYTNGPAGGGGVSRSVRETIGIVSAFIPRTKVEPAIHFEES
jgi:hypothetical protein